MSRTEFFRKIADLVRPEDVSRVAWAYWLAKEVHKSQKRDGGERYFEHCRRVALMAIDYGCHDADSVIVSLLHDSLEDSFIPLILIRKMFGAEVEDALCAISKTEIHFFEYNGSVHKSKKDLGLYFKGIMNYPKTDLKVIKCADRLDNLRSMNNGKWPPVRRLKYINETVEHLLPIAFSVEGHGGKVYRDLRSITLGLAANLD